MSTRADTTERNKRVFLAAYGESGVLTDAARIAGVSRTTVYEWQEHDDHFAHEMRQKLEESTELLEREAIRRARDGVVKETPIHHNGKIIYTVVEHKYSDGLMMFMLKGRKPDTYRENLNIETHERVPLEQARKVLRLGSPRS